MSKDNNNLFLAIALSLVVLLGWNYFYAGPQMERAKRESQAQQGQPGAAPVPGSPSPASGEAVAPSAPGAGAPVPQSPAANRAEALARSPRVAIDTPSLSGSISLTGARIDDIALKNYRETVDPSSPNIVLFSPAGAPAPYFAEFGWVPAAGVTARVPNAQTVWTADAQKLTPQNPVTLTWDNGDGLVFRRKISVDDKAMFTVEASVENKSGQPVSLHPYGLVSRYGKPRVEGFYILHEGMIGVLGDQGLQEVGYDTLDEDGVASGNNRIQTWNAANGGFLGITDKYWASAIIPDQSQPFTGRFASYGGAQRTYQAEMLGESRTVAPGESASATTRLFAGAKETAVIDGYEESLGIRNFELMIDWGWFYFITKPLFFLIDYFYRLVGNFGVAILIVTVLVKTVFFPLANKSYASMAKMKAVQPEMLAIRDRYADDKLRQQQELMDLYKREKINPLAGCWPVLLQIPVFFALYKVLFVTIEMRHAPFFGWIKDLAAPDPTSIFNLFGLVPLSLPAILIVGVWPILMGITMFVQMKMNPEPTDQVQKTMFTWMPVIFTFMLASFPAGLVIYWTWNNLLSIIQQYYIMRKNGVKVELWDNLKGLFSRKSEAKAKS